jgi:NADPH2:quinone reductase
LAWDANTWSLGSWGWASVWRYQFVLLYTVGWERIANAATDLNQAIDDGAFQVGDQAGLPVHRFDLDDTAAAHDAVESAAVGEVLISVSH